MDVFENIRHIAQYVKERINQKRNTEDGEVEGEDRK